MNRLYHTLLGNMDACPGARPFIYSLIRSTPQAYSTKAKYKGKCGLVNAINSLPMAKFQQRH
jgi:hypothetical protein